MIILLWLIMSINIKEEGFFVSVEYIRDWNIIYFRLWSCYSKRLIISL